MQQSDLLEIFTLFYSVSQLLPLSLEHVHLKISVYIVNKERHVLSQLHGQLEYGHLIQMLHRSNLLTPNVLQLYLDSLDWEQESKQTVVLF